MRYRKYYPTLHDLIGSSYAGSVQNNLFSGVHWFDGTLTYIPYGSEDPVYYPDLGFKPADLWTTWFALFEELRIGYDCKCVSPFNGPSAAEWTACASNFLFKAQAALKLMENKYLGLVKTYGLKYNPINNYDMEEVEGTALTEAAYNSTSTVVGSVIVDTDDPERQSQSFSTTYDDTANNRLSNRATTQYLDDETSFRKEGTGATAIPIIRQKTSVDDAPEGETAGYKTISEWDNGEGSDVSLKWEDIETPDSKSATARKMVRRGNIGVMSSQELINQERELAKQNIIEEFFREFNDKVMGTW